jgi:hypothetical protein
MTVDLSEDRVAVCGREPWEEPDLGLCGLTFELSGPTPEWRLARWTDDVPLREAGQVPGRWRSASSEGLGLTVLRLPAMPLGLGE